MVHVPPTGSRVKLLKPLYGYEAGACGIVASDHVDKSGAILVRFDATGHSVPVNPRVLTPDPRPNGARPRGEES
jgi:hypothetical protein